MSQQLPQIGEIIFSATVGGVEVKAQVVEESELGYAVTLTVGDWTAPDEDPYDFGLWFDGSAAPEYFADIDGDGHGELLAPLPKSDLSPTVFRRFRWTGTELSYLDSRALAGATTKEIAWIEPDASIDLPAWVDRFEGDRAVLIQMQGQTPSKTTVEGAALLAKLSGL